MSPRLRAIAREPLVHFVLIGAALLLVDRWRGGGDEEAPPAGGAPAPAAAAQAGEPGAGPRQIVIDQDVRGPLAEALERVHGRPPTEAELDEAIARWIDEEVLYREGLARGLDRDDPSVRRRVADKMALVLEQQIVLPEPDEAELRAWFERRAEDWAEPERVDFTHVFVAGSGAEAEGRAAELLRRLEGGEPPDLLGDRFSGGRRYRGRKLADLAESFGPEFVEGLDRQPIGAWRLRRSRHGLHLVRVDRRREARAADFEAAALDVLKEWQDARRAEELAGRVRALRARWQVIER
ncbi:MAG TPA: peptidylprolyl isomerase [Kofleriaceae bacterium]|nr:peptidylprolyl isomerase [Kofleriaceae bacterium]